MTLPKEAKPTELPNYILNLIQRAQREQKAVDDAYDKRDEAATQDDSTNYWVAQDLIRTTTARRDHTFMYLGEVIADWHRLHIQPEPETTYMIVELIILQVDEPWYTTKPFVITVPTLDAMFHRKDNILQIAEQNPDLPKIYELAVLYRYRIADYHDLQQYAPEFIHEKG